MPHTDVIQMIFTLNIQDFLCKGMKSGCFLDVILLFFTEGSTTGTYSALSALGNNTFVIYRSGSVTKACKTKL